MFALECAAEGSGKLRRSTNARYGDYGNQTAGVNGDVQIRGRQRKLDEIVGVRTLAVRELEKVRTPG